MELIRQPTENPPNVGLRAPSCPQVAGVPTFYLEQLLTRNVQTGSSACLVLASMAAVVS